MHLLSNGRGKLRYCKERYVSYSFDASVHKTLFTIEELAFSKGFPSFLLCLILFKRQRDRDRERMVLLIHFPVPQTAEVEPG